MCLIWFNLIWLLSAVVPISLFTSVYSVQQFNPCNPEFITKHMPKSLIKCNKNNNYNNNNSNISYNHTTINPLLDPPL